MEKFFGSFEMKINYILIIAYYIEDLPTPPFLHFYTFPSSLPLFLAYYKHLRDFTLIRFLYNLNRLQQKTNLYAKMTLHSLKWILLGENPLVRNLRRIFYNAQLSTRGKRSKGKPFSLNFNFMFFSSLCFSFFVPWFLAFCLTRKLFHHALIIVSHFLVLVFLLSHRRKK